MAKGQKRGRPGTAVGGGSVNKKASFSHAKSDDSKLIKKPTAKEARPNQKSNHKVKIPFRKKDNVLLVGEGDFSFSLALLKHHRCKHLTATSYDSEDTLLEKYPSVQTTLDALRSSDRQHKGAQDGERQGQNGGESARSDVEEEWEGFSSDMSDTIEAHHEENIKRPSKTANGTETTAILHSIDARKLGNAKDVRRRSPYTKIVFNFPHVGGVFKDVNRQVRLNQELLVGFFKSCKGLLCGPGKPPPRSPKSDYYDTDDEVDETDEHEDSAVKSSPNGQILLTVFEGEPYTLWNVRDLARHSGYKVIESFRFPWEAYPGYHHARTIGDIHGKEREDGKRSGAWRGEERDARMYVFELNDIHDQGSDHQNQGSKRKKDRDSDDSD